MQSVPLSDAQARLAELLNLVAQGEEVVITQDDQPIARLLAPRPARSLISFRHIEPIPSEAALHPLYPDDNLLEAMMAH